MQSAAEISGGMRPVGARRPQPGSFRHDGAMATPITSAAAIDPELVRGRSIAVLTSGGDAPGMNAAVRAVVRTALGLDAHVFVVTEGYQGMIDGGDGIRQVGWDDVGSILHRGGTIIGTYRSADFRKRDGRRRAAANLIELGVDRLVVIGGDGSLSGLDAFRAEWPDLLAELVADGTITADQAAAHPCLMGAGIVGSIDNDLVGADSTIGADTALHRIVDALDDISSTAASHQRTFVVEVMGRHCGYLALNAAVAGVCDHVLIPETPPGADWAERMCTEVTRGRRAGRRESIVLVAEGVRDHTGAPITAIDVQRELHEGLGVDPRVTILGHVQRGGSPSAFDRWMSTWLGHAAAVAALSAEPGDELPVVCDRHGRVETIPLVDAVRQTRQVPVAIDAGDSDRAMALRGGTFAELHDIFGETSDPPRVEVAESAPRMAVLHAGGLAPGMNAAAFAAVRLGIECGLRVVGVNGGFPGLIRGDVRHLGWADVEGWVPVGGAELGTRRELPEDEDYFRLARVLEDEKIRGLMIVGGFNAYEGAHRLWQERTRYPAFRVPMVLVPASIDNNLPGSELSIGADTALNEITDALDRIKQSASAARRCFVVEVMGRYCGYLAMMGAIAAGAERVYLQEDGLTLADLSADVDRLRASFAAGRRLFLAIRNEQASHFYTTDFIARLFAEESHGLYDVRHNVLGHIQQGGNPTPADRTLAMRLVMHAVDALSSSVENGNDDVVAVGLVRGEVIRTPMSRLFDAVDLTNRRPHEQWWRGLDPVMRSVAELPTRASAKCSS